MRRLNLPKSSNLLGCLTRGSETLKLDSPAYNVNLDIAEFKNTSVGVLEFESVKGVEVHIGGNPKGHNCEEPLSKRLRSGSMAGGDSQNLIDETVRR